MTLKAPNKESYHNLSWVLKNAQNGFYLYTASPLMQRNVAQYYSAPDIALYDYSQNSAPYSFSVLAQWALAQKARAFFVINMHIALREDKDMVNLNLSRDLLAKIAGVWILGLTEQADNRLCKIAPDFYSFIRIHNHFEDEGTINETPAPKMDYDSAGSYYDSYPEARQQMQRYTSLCAELLALPLTAEADRLLSTAITLTNIAELYQKYGQYNQAMELFQRIKDIREKVLGKEHQDTANTYNNIGEMYRSQGEYDQALEWHKKSYRIFLHKLGDAHPHTIESKNDLAAAYSKTGLSEPFEQWLRENFPADGGDL